MIIIHTIIHIICHIIIIIIIIIIIVIIMNNDIDIIIIIIVIMNTISHVFFKIRPSGQLEFDIVRMSKYVFRIWDSQFEIYELWESQLRFEIMNIYHTLINPKP